MNAVDNLIRKIDLLSHNTTPDQIQRLAKHVNTLYVKMMEDRRSKLESVLDLPFQEWFAAYPESHGSTGFGKLFEQWMRYQYNWENPGQKGDPGDAINHNGVRIEIKYATILHKQSGMYITWNRVREETQATAYLLYAHDWRGNGDVYSFYMTKKQALSMRLGNNNGQITACITKRTNSKWEKMEKYLIGIGDRPIVPKHLTTPAKFARIAA